MSIAYNWLRHNELCEEQIRWVGVRHRLKADDDFVLGVESPWLALNGPHLWTNMLIKCLVGIYQSLVL